MPFGSCLEPTLGRDTSVASCTASKSLGLTSCGMLLCVLHLLLARTRGARPDAERLRVRTDLVGVWAHPTCPHGRSSDCGSQYRMADLAVRLYFYWRHRHPCA